MFSKAYEIACNFTLPVLISTKHFDNSVACGVGTFVIINEEGWFITAAHIIDVIFAAQQNAAEISNYYAELMKIDQDFSLSQEQKTAFKAQVPQNPKWIVNHSLWWGFDGLSCEIFHILRENDFAVGKLTNFKADLCKKYPIFKNPAELKFGTSLCKLGFPFHEVKASFNEATNGFQVEPNTLPIPRFPMDGIFTRVFNTGKSADGEFDIKFIETSTPGLRGQSGGPTFDVDGNIWGIQSRTMHLALGFSPKLLVDTADHHPQEVTEHQFMNVGWGVHVETILAFLNKFGIKYYVENTYL